MRHEFPMSPSAAYFHVPFCRHRCGYCDFTLVAGKDFLIGRYLACIGKDLLRDPLPYPVSTLFIGGGTPSHLSVAETETLLGMIEKKYPLTTGGEYSLEANPLDVTRERAEVWKGHGITRVSLGVQSFEERFLKLLERDHRREEVVTAVHLLRECGFDVSLDLIFGVPGQTIEDWERTLEEAIALSPEHLSTYGLTFEKGTSFWNRREAGGLVSLPDEVEREMYGMAMDVLPERGYGQYEISNFARTGKECRHNQTYWSGDEYFAHGPGAARYLQGVRATNHRSVTTWLARMERNESPIMEEERLEPEGQARELLFLGLRRNRGVDRSEYKERTGFDLDQLVGKTIRKHVSLGWIEEVGDGIRLTREGRFVADSVMSDYLA